MKIERSNEHASLGKGEAMWRFFKATTFVAAWALVMSGDRPGLGGEIHVLTPEKNGKSITVRPGDEVHLMLPVRSAFQWGKVTETPNLKEIPVDPKLVPVPDATAKKGQSAKGTVVGGPSSPLIKYKVESVPKEQTIRWVYSMFGKTTVNGVPVPLTEPLKPDRPAAGRGVYYTIKLVPAAPSPPPASATKSSRDSEPARPS